jgi:Holliday junction resolvase RusA-like endonuclease
VREWTGEAEVIGPPVSMGSKRLGRVNGRPVIIDAKDGALRGWQAELRLQAKLCAPPVPLNAPVEVEVQVWLARPASHYGTGKNSGKLKGSAPMWAGVKPDADKIARAALDCLTGIWIVDDSRVVRLTVQKRYSYHAVPRTIVKARAVTDETHADAVARAEALGC